MNRIAEALDIVRRAKLLGDYDSNVVGMAAEVVAEDCFRMTKSPAGSKYIDGHWSPNGLPRSVQVKGWSSNRVARYRGASFFTVSATTHADDLLVLLFYWRVMEYEVLYVGPTNEVGLLQREGRQRYVRLDDLKKGTALEPIIAKSLAQNAA